MGGVTLRQAIEQQNSYRPNSSVAAQLHNKTLIMFVSPAACGKTYLMDAIRKINDDFKQVIDFTTREPRSDDDLKLFRYLPHDQPHIQEILHKITNGDVVQYVVHPSGRFYGTEIADFPGQYNMLAMLAQAVETMRHIPFQQTFTVGIVTKPELWETWFTHRFPIGHPERERRLKEAVVSLSWLKSQDPLSIIWAINTPEHTEQTAKSVINAIVYNKSSEGAALVDAMLEKADNMR